MARFTMICFKHMSDPYECACTNDERAKHVVSASQTHSPLLPTSTQQYYVGGPNSGQPVVSLPRTPLSEYSEADLINAIQARGHVVLSAEMYGQLLAHGVKWSGEIRPAKKPGPPRDRFYVADPESYHSDYD